MTISPYNVKQKQPYQLPNQVYLLAGAILQLQGGVAFLEGSAARAMTLAAPNVGDDGVILHVVATTAQAHTVTVSGGINGTGASGDVGTFGGAKGDGFSCVARNGVWYQLTNTNVTFA